MAARITSLDDFLLLPKGVKPGEDGQFKALCPGHDDRNRSPSIKEADGKLLVKCFDGCDRADIPEPLRLESKEGAYQYHAGAAQRHNQGRCNAYQNTKTR
jgi:hypothetical protein